MARQFIFKDTETGRELVLPVTPGSYDVEHGRKAASLTMQEAGDVNLPGPAVLLDTELTCLLPAQAYPFNQPGAGTNPWVYLEQLEKTTGRTIATAADAREILGLTKHI